MDVGSIGGTDADSEEVNVYVCGASLIAPQVVLTAGHCVEEGIEVDSLLGGQVLLIYYNCFVNNAHSEVRGVGHTDRG